jgi:hypothetical protein
MAVLNRKSRMVSFRLSSGEYDAAVNTCRTQGFRSMSLYARSALLAFESSPNARIPHEAEIIEIRRRLEFLSSEIQKIARNDAPPPNGSHSHSAASEYRPFSLNRPDET